MKKILNQKLLALCFLFSFSSYLASGQARIILNGGKINITNGAFLVIDNPSTDAITRVDGHIISEGENNTVKWNMATNTGSYTVPWGFGNTTYIPLSFEKSAGSGNGSFSFSTYQTGWRNSDNLPADISSFSSNSNTDNSPYVADRFWQMDAQGYSTKPSLTNLQFTYMDAEIAAPNALAEMNLRAQRWNSDAATWGDYLSDGFVNATNNTLTISSVANINLYKWWAMVDMQVPLPVQLLVFTAAAESGNVKLTWATTSELAYDYFTLEHSMDGVNFVTVKIIAANNDSENKQYVHLDTDPYKGKSYYRLKQTSMDGTSILSEIRSVVINSSLATNFTVFPNPVVNNKLNINFKNQLPVKIEITDLKGLPVWSKDVHTDTRSLRLIIDRYVAPGIYLMRVYYSHGSDQQRIFIH